MERVTFVDFGSEWRYWHEDAPVPSSWSDPAFDDRAWPVGNAPLGYNTNESGTRIYPGSSFKMRPLVALFRSAFAVADAERHQSARLVMAVHRNTGFRIFLNGAPVAWDGVPSPVYGSEAPTAMYSNSDTSRLPLQFSIPGRLLKSGRNVIAAETRHARREYGALTFDLALAGGVSVLDRTQFAAGAALPVPPTITVGAQAPDFEWLEVGTKKPRRLREFFGKPFLLQFSGAECLACWKKLPVIRRWADAGIQCLSISSWGTVDDMASPAERHAKLLDGIAVGAEPKAYDPQQTACYRLYGIFNGSILVGADARVLAVATGFALDDFLREAEAIDAAVRSLGARVAEMPRQIRVVGGADDWRVVTTRGPEVAGIGSSMHSG
ncbi:MAG: hypothetical protein JO101_04290 [Candidatus Eremiobacteraeota bacterium]|nr:hypothetical protein [Candidatus Eremiobacteraeota bacterium]